MTPLLMQQIHLYIVYWQCDMQWKEEKGGKGDIDLSINFPTEKLAQGIFCNLPFSSFSGSEDGMSLRCASAPTLSSIQAQG